MACAWLSCEKTTRSVQARNTAFNTPGSRGIPPTVDVFAEIPLEIPSFRSEMDANKRKRWSSLVAIFNILLDYRTFYPQIRFGETTSGHSLTSLLLYYRKTRIFEPQRRQRVFITVGKWACRFVQNQARLKSNVSRQYEEREVASS